MRNWMVSNNICKLNLSANQESIIWDKGRSSKFINISISDQKHLFNIADDALKVKSNTKDILLS